MRFSVGAVPVLVGVLVLAACATQAVPRPYPGWPRSPSAPSATDADERPERPVAGETGEPATASTAGAAAVDAAEALLGAPYRSGGAGPDGFDCSGFVQYVFARAGISLPRSVREQWQTGEAVERGDLRRGDLVFFAIGGREVSHVGVVVDAETFVHAPSSRGVVRIERLGAEYWARRLAGARRVTEPQPPTRAAAGAGGSGAWRSAETGATRDRPR